MRNRNRHHGPGAQGVQLGLIITPMLDMSFQILAFFIMTYHPSALEGHIPGSLAPPEEKAEKSKDNKNPDPPPFDPLSIPEDDLMPELDQAITVNIRAVMDNEDKWRPYGSPAQFFLRSSLDTEKQLIAEVDGQNVTINDALKALDRALKDLAAKGATKANLKLAPDGDLRQEYVMRVYDVCKQARYDKIHFVPPPVLNTKLKR